MHFDFYFSTHSGLIVELPFLSLEVSALAIYALLCSVVALRLRKAFIDHNRAKVAKSAPSTPSVFDFENDWSN